MSGKRKTPLPFPQSGACIKHYRILRGYSQEQLADMVGMSASYFGYIERGRQMASTAYLRKLSLALSVPIEALLVPGYSIESPAMCDVLSEMVRHLDGEECKIAYRLMTSIVPMIRQKQLKV